MSTISVILLYEFHFMSNSPLFHFQGAKRQLGGAGREYSALEWDIMGYFALNGGLHDAAVAAWSVKGHYDYIRPICAIRYMCERGQRSDPVRHALFTCGMVQLLIFRTFRATTLMA